MICATQIVRLCDKGESLHIFGLFGIIASVIFAIYVVKSNEMQIKPIESSRVKIIEHTTANGYGYTILKVDSVEYLQIGNNAIIRISK